MEVRIFRDKKPKLKGEKVISGEEKNKEKGDRDSLRETKKSCASGGVFSNWSFGN